MLLFPGCASLFIPRHYLLWCNQAAVWVAVWALDRVIGLKWWQACGPGELHCPWKTIHLLSPIQADLPPFHLLFLLLLFRIFLPGVATPFPPHLLFLSKLKCLQMSLLVASSKATPKCHLGCQVLLHMSMVHSRTKCSWVTEHCTATAVEHRTNYFKRTPLLVITDLVLVTHQYALPFYIKLPRRSTCKMKHTQ